MSFTEREFRDCMGKFPTGVTIVTTKNKDGKLIGITVNSFASVSLDPPLVLFSLISEGFRSQFFLEENKSIGINFLSRGQENLSQLFANPGLIEWEKMGVTYDLTDNSVPLLQDCSANLECSVKSIYPGGDHEIIVCKVEKLYYTHESNPLIYYRGNYCHLGDK